jgi:uncharacterized protein YneR
MKITINNQLNDGFTIEICVGEKEHTLRPDHEVTVEVEDEDIIYFDTVYQDCSNGQDSANDTN